MLHYVHVITACYTTVQQKLVQRSLGNKQTTLDTSPGPSKGLEYILIYCRYNISRCNFLWLECIVNCSEQTELRPGLEPKIFCLQGKSIKWTLLCDPVNINIVNSWMCEKHFYPKLRVCQLTAKKRKKKKYIYFTYEGSWDLAWSSCTEDKTKFKFSHVRMCLPLFQLLCQPKMLLLTDGPWSD